MIGLVESLLRPMLRMLDCEQIHFQQAARGFSEVRHLRDWPSDKDLGVGVIDVQRSPAEHPGQIADWIRAALEVVDELLLLPIRSGRERFDRNTHHHLKATFARAWQLL